MPEKDDSTHSPIPWRDAAFGIRGEDGPDVLQLLDANGRLITELNYTSEGGADAEFIVRAVNARDALVAALEAVMNGASEFGADYSAGMPRSLWLAMEQGEDALRLAKGEAS